MATLAFGSGTREKLPITPSRLKGSLTPWTAGWTSWTPRSYRFNQQLQQLCQQQQPLPAEFRSIETRLGDGFRYLSFPSTKLRFRVRGRLDVLVNPGPTRSKPFATICGKCAPYLGILGAWKNNASQLCARIWSDDIVVPCCPSQHEIKDLANSRTSVEHDFHLHLQWNLVSMKIWLTTNRFTWCIGRTSFRPQRKCWVRWVCLMYQVCLQYFAVPCQCCAVLSVGVVTSVSMVIIQHVSTTVTLIYDLAQIQDVASSRSETSVVANMSSSSWHLDAKTRKNYAHDSKGKGPLACQDKDNPCGSHAQLFNANFRGVCKTSI